MPKSDADPGNITYTISSQDPPRSISTFQEVPIDQAIKPKVPINQDDPDRRGSFGELIFTVAESFQTTTGSSKKTFEVGDLLEFSVDVEAAEFNQNIGQTEIRHDTNLLDLLGVGLNQVDVNRIIGEAEHKYVELTDELNRLTAQIEDVKVSIKENQKSINETQKVINAVSTVSGSDDPALDKLNKNLSDLEAEKQALIDELRVIESSATFVRDDLFKVSQLVR